MGKILKKNILFLLPIAGIVCFFIRHLYLIFSNSFPIGIDGFYYLLQIQSYVKNGFFYFPTDAPLVLYFFISVDHLINDPVLTIKICVIFLDLLLLTGIFAVVFAATRSYLYAIIAPLLLNVSGLYLYFLVEYINQLGALAFLFWGIFFLIRFARSRRFLWLVPAILFFTAACFSHRSMIPVLLAAALGFILFIAVNSNKIKSKRKYCVGIWSAVGLLIISPAILKIQPFGSLPPGLQNEVTFIPHFPSHFATLPEVIILLILIPPLLWLLIYKPAKDIDAVARYFFGVVAIWSLLVTLNPFISSALGFVSIGGRLRTLACFQVALLLPALLWLVKDYDKWFGRGIALFAALFLTWSFASPLPHGAQAAYLSRRGTLINSLKEKQDLIEKGSFIVADHGEQFVVTAVTGFPASQDFPAEESNYDKIYWLLNGIPATFVDDKMQVLFTDRSGKMTVLVQHNDDFKKRLANSDLRKYLFASNPHLFLYLRQAK